MNLCNDTVLPPFPYANNEVVCNCSFPGGVCHVVAIYLNGQDLDGSLPKAIQKLPHLKQLSLWANYLSGNIPPEWANTKLEILFLDVNRLTGKIPSYLGQITTLRYLSIENNMFSGTVPPELGDLVNLESLGELPLALANLIRLKQLRLSKAITSLEEYPEFIRSWKQLDALYVLISTTRSESHHERRTLTPHLIFVLTERSKLAGFTGPIPSNISLLTSLTELRISNLLGNGSEIPNLDPIANITYLTLRNCNLSGKFPQYLTNKSQLQILDLSFNRLSGPLPPSFEGLPILEKMYLTWNNFTGPFPQGINTRSPVKEIDLSYNNFTSEAKCKESLNLFKSTWGWNYSKPVECVSACSAEEKDAPASQNLNLLLCLTVSALFALILQTRYSVHINCGGSVATIGNTTYEADNEEGGAAKYAYTREDWQKSTTGHFWDFDFSWNYYVALDSSYIAQNMSILNMSNSVLYTEASLTPLSLTYYIPCLVNGNYNVKLHFAEIVIRGNRSYSSLGRRVFDVYIQDFNIVTKAGGVDKVYIHNCTALVTNRALEIRLHWAGKGTIWSPEPKTYGPLISAIDVESGRLTYNGMTC
ncbi:hypothetical protein OIU84_027736 [Salix udensis]|uniref:non-specific serine/threonine protein kinase n=1 Tax=Salix udensis TaxID=889485 RepID=A0AAD6PBW2_9ROSI|nr:hypothetical protein OIU84_027736 [Salix udensis]